tara:strand:- start:229 stop:387 length:159 start_codon:yes stop_codon:yes gene_type:complete
MKGANTEPCAIMRSPPSIIIITIMGVSHNFFLILRNKNSSLINSILLIKTDF